MMAAVVMVAMRAVVAIRRNVKLRCVILRRYVNRRWGVVTIAPVPMMMMMTAVMPVMLRAELGSIRKLRLCLQLLGR